MNKCIFIGNLTRDPEAGSTNSGISFCRFSIAVNRTYAGANGERETDYINVVTWRGLADNCSKYLSKGSKVCVSGQLQTRSYEAQDGSRRNTFEIVAEDVEFIGSRPAAGEGAPERAPAAPANKKVSELKPIETGEDDFPF